MVILFFDALALAMVVSFFSFVGMGDGHFLLLIH